MADFIGQIVKDAPRGRHYRPLPGTEVKWSRFGKVEAVKPLNINAPYDGDKIRRWGGGDTSLIGAWMMVGRVEANFGDAFAILQELFRQHGITDDPEEVEAIDFAVSNVPGGERVMGPQDWLRLTGRETPIPQEPLGTVRNPIIVADDRFLPNHKMKVGDLFYMNDLREGKGRFPDVVTEPAKPPGPTVPPPATTPPPPTKPGATTRTVAIDYRFDKALEFNLSPGTTRVHFDGQLLIAAAVKAETRSPILKVAVGPEPPKGSKQRRFNVGSPVVNASGGRALEWADKTQPVGGGRLPLGQLMPIVFTWTAGTGSVVVWNGRRKETGPLPNLADQGGIVVFGVNPSDDPKADYVPLPAGSRLVGTLTVTSAAGTQPQPGTGPVDPDPVIPPAVPGSGLLEMAREALVKAEDARNTMAALVNALGG